MSSSRTRSCSARARPPTPAACRSAASRCRQNSLRLQWTSDEVDKRLSDIMKAIHNQCVRYGEQDKFINYVDGANIAGFRKVAEAMLDQGVV